MSPSPAKRSSKPDADSPYVPPRSKRSLSFSKKSIQGIPEADESSEAFHEKMSPSPAKRSRKSDADSPYLPPRSKRSLSFSNKPIQGIPEADESSEAFHEKMSPSPAKRSRKSDANSTSMPFMSKRILPFSSKSPSKCDPESDEPSETCHEGNIDTPSKLRSSARRSASRASIDRSPSSPISQSRASRKSDISPLHKEAMTPKSKRFSISTKPCLTPITEAPSTPKSIKGSSARKSLYSTPQSAKLRNGPETPRTPIDEARANLHISAVPKSLPCRKTEFDSIYNFLVRKIESQSGGVMYISGVPGTGKTATVHKVIQLLEEEAENDELDQFVFVEVNALRISEPRQAYCKIWKDLTGESASTSAAQSLLEKKFSRPAKKATIILVDELDYLCNRRQDVIYNILDWTTKRDSRLVVLTIANTMDLPERTLKGRVTSRMGLTRLMFQPYSHTQLQEIVMNRLDNNNVFHPDAVQLVSRKVAAVSGDARRALDICRRATELVDGEKSLVKIDDVQKVLNNIFTGARVLTIQNCSEIEKLVLKALRDESQRTGVEETHLKKMYSTLTTLCQMEALYAPDVGSVSQVCSKLSGMGLIIAEKNTQSYLYRKLILNVNIDDLHYALDC